MTQRNKPRLAAPAHLQGKLGNHLPMALRDERREWIAEKRAIVDERGRRVYTNADLGEALGIDSGSVQQIIRKAGLDAPIPPLPRTTASLLGLRMVDRGGLWALFEGLPDEVRDGIIDHAAKHDISLVAAAFEIAAAAMQKGDRGCD